MIIVRLWRIGLNMELYMRIIVQVVNMVVSLVFM